ncbi:glycosyltransferase family 2 protein [Algiphilus aromaticivorans]|uniref:glycosyltransferase family 2 protein n=1 Tax=Algiphilus aromaticivorans TaxID=382454 RepID=UPI0018DCD8D9|nr:glycosyltransferase family 2 protein [Algiphilus aromaticivorans]
MIVDRTEFLRRLSTVETSDRPCLSVVVPVLNEQEAIMPFLERLDASLADVAARFPEVSTREIIFVDDGSRDATLMALVQSSRRFQGVRIVSLTRSFGKDVALSAGLDVSRGRAVIPMDVDLQDPPEVIVQMVKKWLGGAKLVNGVRADRSSDTFLKRFSASLFYRIYNRFADVPITAEAGDFRLMDREIVDILRQLPERVRFMKGLYTWTGYEAAEVAYTREARASGRTNWSMWRLWNFALDGITGSTTVPLRIWTYFGAAIALASFIYAMFIVVSTLAFGRTTPGYASLITVVLVLGGINLIALGVLGEYIGRIFHEVKRRPLYVVETSFGFDDATEGDD